MIKLLLLFLLPLVSSQGIDGERDNHTTWDDDTFRWIIPSETVTRTDGFQTILRKKTASLLWRVRDIPNSILRNVVEHYNWPVVRHFVCVLVDKNRQTCGKVQLAIPTPLVVNGNATLEGQWPWQVAIYRTESVNLNYICGGTVINHKHVLTAAHCTTLPEVDPFQKVEENSLMIYLGKHNLITSRRGVQTRSVERITIHPGYNSTIISTSDLSILRLQEAVLYSDWVQPACLWPKDMKELSNVVGKTGSVVGWGNTGSGILKLAEMPIVDHLTCILSKSDFYDKVLSNYNYCAGRKDGRSVCNGDSGSGMVFQMNGTWYLRGVVSTSPSKNNDPMCDPFHYVIFTDVAMYLTWIQKNTVY